MDRLNVFRATTATPTARVSSGLHGIATIADLKAEPAELVTTAVAAASGMSGWHRVAKPQRRRIGTRRVLWFAVQPALSVGGIVAAREPAAKAIDGSAGGSADASPPNAVSPAASHSAAAAPARSSAHSAHPSPRAPASHATPAAAARSPATGAHSATSAPPTAAATPERSSSAPAAQHASAISRIELTIDSLRTYDLIRPIPVVVEVLGERNYVAEMPDLNISISASNQSEIIIVLKDRIAQVYEGLRLLKHLDAEQSRQLKVLETYIAKTRRGWLDRR